jgi:uncharacterized membrane protein YdbT with pleckstrin-like domain
MSDSEDLCQALLSSKYSASEVSEVKPEEPPAVYKASFKDLMLAGALQNRALYIVAVIGGLFNNNIGDLIKQFMRAIDRIPYLKATSESPILLALAVTLGIATLLAIGWILSITLAVVTYHGFRVVRREKGIDIQYGLFNTVRTTIQINKIQSISTNSSWLFRMFDFSQLHAQSIGGFKVNEQVATGQTLLAPIARPEIIKEIMDLIYPQIKVNSSDFRMCHPYFRKRELLSSSIAWAFLLVIMGTMFRVIFNNSAKTLGGFFGSGAFPLLLFGVWIVVTCIHAYTSLVAYKRLGFIVAPEFIYVRSGVFNENITIQPVRNIQSIELRSNPFSRMRGLVDVVLSTPVSSSTIPCITKEDGERLKEQLMSQSTHAGI